jgi:hypothetical protein
MDDDRAVRLQRAEQVLLRHELDVARLSPFWWRARVRILVVTDGSGSFDSTASFGLGRALDEVRNDPWWWVRFELVTAHRGGGSSADHTNFRFDAPPVELAGFDQLWLFGVQSAPALASSEVAAIRAFMDGGGGVFATGDHDELGAALSGDLPRVNAMRRWRSGGPAGSPPPQSGPSRHDTTRQGATPGYQFNDQSDNTPQRILPTRYYDPFRFSVLNQRWRPHPVLCGRSGVLDLLPDHMHEGECVAPSASVVAANPGVWPGGHRPEVIARARVEEHTNTDGHGFVAGKTFGVLSAYDGHLAGVGRIVTDATWHHWFNINLIGFDQSSAHYDQIRNYFQNVALWLAPAAKQDAMFSAATYGLIWLQPFNELQIERGGPLVKLGFSAVDAIGRRASQCIVNDWILAKLPLLLREELYRRPLPEPDPLPMSAGLETVRELVVGGILESLREQFDPFDPPSGPPEEELVVKLVNRGVTRGLDAVVEVEKRGLAQCRSTLELLEKSCQQS